MSPPNVMTVLMHVYGILWWDHQKQRIHKVEQFFLLISAFQWISSALQAWWTVAGRCLDMVPGLLWCFWSCVKVLAMHYVDPCCFDRRCTHDQTDWLERGAKHCAQDMIVDNASWMRISQQFFKTKHTWKFHENPNLMKDLNLSYLIMF